MFHDTEECPKFEEKLTLGSKNDMKNLVNINVIVASLKVCSLMCYFSQ